MPKQKRPSSNSASNALANDTYYHITAIENVPRILADGLKGFCSPRYRGEEMSTPSIFCLVSPEINLVKHVARTQLWPIENIQRCAVISISSLGITVPLKSDNVAERVAVFSRVIEQDLISPQYLRHCFNVELNHHLYLPCYGAACDVGEQHLSGGVSDMQRV